MKKILILIIFLGSLHYAECQTIVYDELIIRADSLYHAKQYRESALIYVAAFKDFGWRGLRSDWYNAACSWALAGEPDSAFINLERIIQNLNPPFYLHMRVDSDLVSLHSDKRWNTLVKEAFLNKQFSREMDSLKEIDKQHHKIYHKKDSIFIRDVKQFIYNEFGTKLHEDIYTTFEREDKPLLLVNVSLSNKVETPAKLQWSYKISNYEYWGKDETEAQKVVEKYEKQGYQTFLYKTYGYANAGLTTRFLKYQDEAKSFILFHELTHHYVAENKMNIPSEFNEAMADVIGNYGTLEYSMKTHNIEVSKAKKQIKINEEIYEYINYYIDKINNYRGKSDSLDTECDKKIKPLIEIGNLFQQDRFDYMVNNAYLLKNKDYSKYYFLLKQLYLKQGSIRKLLEIMKGAPEKSEDIAVYLQKFI